MIYFLITTSLYNDSKLREKQYTIGITTLGEIVKIKGLMNYNIIIIENNGTRRTFLDTLGYDVFYTNNNLQSADNNIGTKELKDINDAIKKYNINDNDLIVKMTGRYILENNSEFIDTLIKAGDLYDCIIKYGSYNKPVNDKMEDCITGLIAMKCKYVKEIKQKNRKDCIEWAWARATYDIPDNNIHKVDKLGIYICPASNNYFQV